MRKIKTYTASTFLFLGLLLTDLPAKTSSFHPPTENVIKERLMSMKSSIKPVYHPTVLSYIESYIYRARVDTRLLVGHSTVYFPVFEHYLDLYGLPRELKYLAAWESKLNLTATSPVGAGGLWQMMPATARKYGLTVNRRVDERFDLHKSTEAAVLYLADLYEIFGDWTLVSAAYNCGEGRVIRAIKTGGTRDYWQLRRYLPRETLNYIPAILATTYAMQFYHFYDIRPRYPDYSDQLLRTSVIYYGTTFREIVKMTGISKKKIAALNPSYLGGIIPANFNGNYIRMPENETARFRDIWSKIQRKRGVKANSQYNPNREASYPVLCVVRSGDSLDYLSKLYKVPVKNIIEWNDLKTNRLVAFQELLIRIPVINKSRILIKT
ncbi:MAG: membrane-bound lytic murein transglycosylase D [Saprospiraceae bacterium]|jgi:membrane-bound lytic murein transglycosylase D